MPFKVPTPLIQASSAEKRSSEGGSAQQAKKAMSLPPLHDLVAVESTPKRASAQRPSRPPLSMVITLSFCVFSTAIRYRSEKHRAPLQICVYKVTDRASDAWNAFEGTSAKLWQIQLDHGARPSCLFDLRRNLCFCLAFESLGSRKHFVVFMVRLVMFV